MRFLLLLTVLLSCSQTNSDQREAERTYIQSTKSFTQNDVRAVDLASLNKLKSSHKEVLKDYLGWSTPFEAYAYDIIEDGSSIILLNSVRGRALYLMIYDEDRIRELVGLTRDQCDLMDQFDDYELIHCDVITSSIAGSELSLYKVFIETKDFGDRTENVKDSISYNYKLGSTIILINKDSVRMTY